MRCASNWPPPIKSAFAAQRFQKCFWRWNISWNHSILTIPEFCKVCLCEFGAERLGQRRAFTRCRWESTKLYYLEVEGDFRICVLIIISNPTILPFDDKLQHQRENWWINTHTMKTTSSSSEDFTQDASTYGHKRIILFRPVCCSFQLLARFNKLG